MYRLRRYQPPPYIIRHIKKHGMDENHVHGAWKVAYADMMTAMMAFFLLLWLYSTLDPQKKNDVANYFAPTAGIIGDSGLGLQGGQDWKASKGKSNQMLSAKGLVKAHLQQGPLAGAQDVIMEDSHDDKDTLLEEEENRRRWQKEFMAVQNDIKQMLQHDYDKSLKDTLLMEKTSDGLKINIMNDPARPVFIPRQAKLTNSGKRQVISLLNIIAHSKHTISIASHLATNGLNMNTQYSGWELSVDRALSVRRLLGSSNLRADCVMKVEGLSDQDLLVEEEPANPRNERITLTVLTGDCAAQNK